MIREGQLQAECRHPAILPVLALLRRLHNPVGLVLPKAKCSLWDELRCASSSLSVKPEFCMPIAATKDALHFMEIQFCSHLTQCVKQKAPVIMPCTSQKPGSIKECPGDLSSIANELMENV